MGGQTLMNRSPRRNMALLGVVALLLASTLLFLYLKSSSGQTSTYTESRDLIGRMKQLNAQWDTEILKARIAITHNYDPLVLPLIEMTRLWSRFDSMESSHGRDHSLIWSSSHDAYLAAIAEKTRLVEQFKSHNAVLRNSLAFLPTAEDDIQQPLAELVDGDKLQLQNIATDTYDLLLSSMEFAQVTSDDKAAEILVGLNKLGVNKTRLPEPFHEPIDILSNHIALILSEQPIVNRLLDNIEAVPVAERLDDITGLLNRSEEQTSELQSHHE